MSLERLEDKLDKVVDSVASIDKTLAGQAVQIAEHIRRTDLLEAHVKDVAADLKPVAAHVQRIKGAATFIGFVITLAEAFRQFWH